MSGSGLRKKSTPTVADVAAAAGVAKATAARALGRYGPVSSEVRDKVFSAALALGYRPNELARSMATGRTGTIGVVVGDIENPFFSIAVRGITDMARTSGFTVVVTNSGERVEDEQEAIRTLLAKRVDGMIVTPASSHEIAHLQDVVRANVPLVLLDRAIPELEVDTVTADDRTAAVEATRLLLRTGRRKISYVTACKASEDGKFRIADIQTASVRERVDGFLAECSRFAIPPSDLQIVPGASSYEKTRALARKILSSSERPDAIFASDSQIAIGFFETAMDMGLAIPSDLSLITFHNADWTRVTSPSVAVIDQPIYQLGSTAASLLNKRLNNTAEPPQRITLDATLLPRGSVSAAL